MAFLFIPLVVWGVHDLLQEDFRHPHLLFIGYVGLYFSHIVLVFDNRCDFGGILFDLFTPVYQKTALCRASFVGLRAYRTDYDVLLAAHFRTVWVDGILDSVVEHGPDYGFRGISFVAEPKLCGRGVWNPCTGRRAVDFVCGSVVCASE